MAPRDLAVQLRLAHEFLVSAARLTVPRIAELQADRWGSLVKREYVRFAQDNRPSLICPKIREHSFAEVVNHAQSQARQMFPMLGAQRVTGTELLILALLLGIGGGLLWRFASASRPLSA